MSVDIYIIKHSSYERIIGCLKQCHDSQKKHIKPKNLLLMGVSGVGKSTLLKAYRDMHERYDLAELTIIPILYVCLPSRPLESAIYAEILKALDDPFPFQGTVTERRHRIIFLFEKCRVELLILDEVQHFLDRGKLKTHTANADSLKSLIDAIECPVILAGAPRCKELFRLNTQLRGRFKSNEALVPFSIFSDESKSSYKKLMKAMLRNSVFSNIDFFDDEMKLKRFFYATDGVLRNIADLICLADELAQQEKVVTLSLRLLQLAFQSWICVDLKFKKNVNPNPFDSEFSERRLTLPGELYEPSDFDGDNHGWSH